MLRDMHPTPQLDDAAALGDVLENTQSTHSLAAQASAGKLLFELRRALGTGVTLTPAQQAQAQRYLIHYLDHKISDTPAPAMPEILTSVSGILAFVDYVAAQTTDPFNNLEKRNRVFQEIQRLVDLGTDHWTINNFYHDKAEIQIDASLEETLNLVCLALQNNVAGYAALQQGTPEDEQQRLLSLFNRLYESSLNPACTGGSQHALLFSLNGVYPLETAGHYEAVHLIEDVNAFFLDCMREFLARQIKATFNDSTTAVLAEENPISQEIREVGTEKIGDVREKGKEKIDENPEDDLSAEIVGSTTPSLLQVVRSWLKYDAGIEPTRLPELEAWLQAQVDPLQAYLREQCEQHGLNPDAHNTQEYATHLDDLACPAGIDETIPLFTEFFAALKKAGPASRNAAQEKIKNLLETTPSLDALRESLADYMKAETFYQRLEEYRALTVFLGEAEGEFKAAIEQLAFHLERCFNCIAQGYFTDVAVFAVATQTFLEAEKRFKQEHPVDLITNFFALLSDDFQNFRGLWNSLNRRHEQNSLLLTDAVIETWLARATAAEAGLVIEITPYEINRVLLHAALTLNAINAWTDRFKMALQAVISWLLDTSSEPHALRDNAFRRSYPKDFLVNLQLALLVAELPFCQAVIRSFVNENSAGIFLICALRELLKRGNFEQNVQVWAAVQNKLPVLITNGDQLAALFHLSAEQLTSAQREQILAALEGKLPALITDGDQLAALFHLSKTQLTPAQRGQILTALQDKLPALIPDGDQLAALFRRSETQLTTAQRGQILTVLQDKLPALITNGSQLTDLFHLSEAQLTPAQRGQILTALQDQLPALITDGSQLTDLFDLSETQLTLAQRGQILTALQDKLPALITDGSQLTDLFCLSETRLTPTQRGQILTVLQDKLPALITNGSQLTDLFHLSEAQLTLAQRGQILTALQDKLPALIPDGFQLVDSFRRSDTELTLAQRKQIWEAVQDQLPALITDGDQLAKLFSLSDTELTSAQRGQILAALQDKLPALITDGDQLADLFSLSETELTPAQRDQIWDAVQDTLPELITNGDQLAPLFSLSETELTPAQREQIWDAVQDTLPALIADGTQLAALFKLSETQLTPAQREQIWAAVQDMLPALIADGTQLAALFKLSETQLNTAQREQIWAAVQDKFPELIKDGFGFGLARLFRLSETQLTPAQRKQIWDAVQDKLPTWIANGYQLAALFSLSERELTLAQREQIWDAVQDTLLALIKDGYELAALFDLSKEQLTPVQRRQILAALKGQDKLGSQGLPASASAFRFFKKEDDKSHDADTTPVQANESASASTSRGTPYY